MGLLPFHYSPCHLLHFVARTPAYHFSSGPFYALLISQTSPGKVVLWARNGQTQMCWFMQASNPCSHTVEWMSTLITWRLCNLTEIQQRRICTSTWQFELYTSMPGTWNSTQLRNCLLFSTSTIRKPSLSLRHNAMVNILVYLTYKILRLLRIVTGYLHPEPSKSCGWQSRSILAERNCKIATLPLRAAFGHLLRSEHTREAAASHNVTLYCIYCTGTAPLYGQRSCKFDKSNMGRRKREKQHQTLPTLLKCSS